MSCHAPFCSFIRLNSITFNAFLYKWRLLSIGCLIIPFQWMFCRVVVERWFPFFSFWCTYSYIFFSYSTYSYSFLILIIIKVDVLRLSIRSLYSIVFREIYLCLFVIVLDEAVQCIDSVFFIYFTVSVYLQLLRSWTS